MSDLPTPMTPEDCDCRGFDFMPLLGHRLFTSKWYSLARRKDPRGGIAALKLWWVAFLERPAASLPNDENELCMLADFGEDLKSWRKHREVAMYGFILCSDDRWYHPIVAEEAMESYARRLKATKNREADADRLRKWRASNKGTEPPPKPNGHSNETHTETRFVDHSETHPETHHETASEGVSKRVGQEKTVQEVTGREESKEDSLFSSSSGVSAREVGAVVALLGKSLRRPAYAPGAFHPRDVQDQIAAVEQKPKLGAKHLSPEQLWRARRRA